MKFSIIGLGFLLGFCINLIQNRMPFPPDDEPQLSTMILVVDVINGVIELVLLWVLLWMFSSQMTNFAQANGINTLLFTSLVYAFMAYCIGKLIGSLLSPITDKFFSLPFGG